MNKVTVLIHNNLAQARTIKWLKTPRWIPGLGDIEVDYEPWSCADSQQKKDLQAECASGWTSLLIRLPQKGGTVIEQEYSLGAGYVPSVPVSHSGASAKPLYPEPQKAFAGNPLMRDNQSHTVIAPVNKAARMMGFKAENPAPPTAQNISHEPHTGFVKEAAHAQSTTDAIRARFTQPKAEPVQEPPVDDIAERFNALTAEKKWDDALQLLIERYGKERITFNVRTIMAMKTFEAIAAKYGL